MAVLVAALARAVDALSGALRSERRRTLSDRQLRRALSDRVDDAFRDVSRSKEPTREQIDRLRDLKWAYQAANAWTWRRLNHLPLLALVAVIGVAAYIALAEPSAVDASIDAAVRGLQFRLERSAPFPAMRVRALKVTADSVEYTPEGDLAPQALAANVTTIVAGAGGGERILMPPFFLEAGTSVTMQIAASASGSEEIVLDFEHDAPMEALIVGLSRGDLLQIAGKGGENVTIGSARRATFPPSKRVSLTITPGGDELFDLNRPLSVSALAFVERSDERWTRARSVVQFSSIDTGTFRITQLPGRPRTLTAGERFEFSGDGWLRQLSWSHRAFTVKWQGVVDRVAVGGPDREVSLMPSILDMWADNYPWQTIAGLVGAASACIAALGSFWRRIRT